MCLPLLKLQPVRLWHLYRLLTAPSRPYSEPLRPFQTDLQACHSAKGIVLGSFSDESVCTMSSNKKDNYGDGVKVHY